MTDLYATLTPIGETTMSNDNSVGDITTEEEALEVLKQVGEVLARGGTVEEELILALGCIPEKLLTTELCLKR